MANKFNPAEHELKETLVALNRVSKTVKVLLVFQKIQYSFTVLITFFI